MHAIARTQCNSNSKESAIIILHSIAYANKARCIHCIIPHINIKLLMFYIVHGGTIAHTPTAKQESDSKVKQSFMHSYNKTSWRSVKHSKACIQAYGKMQ